MTRHNWNVAEAFASAAGLMPSKTAIVGPRSLTGSTIEPRPELSFQALLQRVRRCAAGWTQLGVGVGDRVLIMAQPSVDFLIAVLSLQWVGAVPVFMDGGLPVERVLQLVAEADAVALVAGAEVLQLKAAVPAPFQRVRTVVSAGPALAGTDASVAEMTAGGAEAPAPARLGPDDLVGIVFTSGSTGLPKGVEFSAEMAFAGVEWIAAGGLGAADVYLAILPSHLIGSLMLGMTCVLPDIDVRRPGDAEPSAIVQQVVECNVTYTVGPPSLWTRIAAHCAEHALTMPSLRVVNVSGAAVPPKLLQVLMQALPSGEVRTPLGATEGSPITDIGAREVLADAAEATTRGAGVCVGPCIAGHELKVIEIQDRPFESWSQVTELPVGAIGELVMTGPVVSKRYFRRSAETAASKIVDDRGRIWHRLGDCGYLDDKGRVWYCGRIAHIVKQGGVRVYSVQVEEVFNELPGVERTALVQPHGDGEKPIVLVVEPKHGRTAEAYESLRQSIRARTAELGMVIDHVLFHPQPLPVDARHNSKIERGELARWSSAQLSLATNN
jgi:acyl-CoA synthetase (AMP-forming)/AMP-acid ligase II